MGEFNVPSGPAFYVVPGSTVKLVSQEAKPLPHRYAALKKKTADLVDHSCTIADEARPNAM
jgi:hypothetical protein